MRTKFLHYLAPLTGVWMTALLAAASLAGGQEKAQPFMRGVTRQAIHDVQIGAAYDARSDRTFIAYAADRAYNPYIRYYDHREGVFSEPVRFGRNPAARDGHGSPSLFIDSEGYLHAGVGGHGKPMAHYKSKAPRSLERGFRSRIVSDGSTSKTYTFFLEDARGALYMCVGQGATGAWSDVGFYRSTDGGESWRFRTLTEVGHMWWACHPAYDAQRNRIYWLASIQRGQVGQAEGAWKHLYAFYYDIGEDRVFALDGHEYGRTVDSLKAFNEHSKVPEPPDKPTHAQIEPGKKIYLNAAGEPCIPFTWSEQGRLKVRGERVYHYGFGRWDADRNRWRLVYDIETADARTDEGDLRLLGDGRIEYVLANSGSPQTHIRGGDVLIYESADGGATWSKQRTVLRESEVGRPLKAPTIPLNHHEELMLLTCTYGKERLATDHWFFAWGNGGFLTD